MDAAFSQCELLPSVSVESGGNEGGSKRRAVVSAGSARRKVCRAVRDELLQEPSPPGRNGCVRQFDVRITFGEQE